MPRASTLSRLHRQRFLIAIFGMFALCSVLIFMIDFVELLRQAGKYGSSVPAWLLAWMTLLRLPAYTEILLPFAVLVGCDRALLMLSSQERARRHARRRHVGLAVPAARALWSPFSSASSA